VRETSKLLAATLITLCVVLLGVAASAAGARTSHGARHVRPRAKRSLVARCVRHPRRCDSTKTLEHSSHHTAARPKVTPAPKPAPKEHSQTHGHHRAATENEEAESGEGDEGGETKAQQTAAIASALATTCQNTEVTPTPEDLAVVRGAVMCLINRERAEHGVAPLHASTELEGAAEGHCSEMIAENYFAHVAPDGETPVQRIEKTGYIPGPSVGYVVGENLAWGTYSLSTPQSIVAAWIASPEHLANILESRYTETGIAITPSVPASLGEGNPGATYAQEFGVIVR
jgi:uncharacterized protein YkwD